MPCQLIDCLVSIMQSMLLGCVMLHAFKDLLARAGGSRRAAIELVRVGTLTWTHQEVLLPRIANMHSFTSAHSMMPVLRMSDDMTTIIASMGLLLHSQQM